MKEIRYMGSNKTFPSIEFIDELYKYTPQERWYIVNGEKLKKGRSYKMLSKDSNNCILQTNSGSVFMVPKIYCEQKSF